MPYVQRDSQNKVVAVASTPKNIDGPEEFLDESHPHMVAFRAPLDPVDTELLPEDIERLFIGLGVTRGQINQAKNDRGEPR